MTETPPHSPRPPLGPSSARKEDANAILTAAVTDHRAGRLPQARAGYERLLQLVPDHPDALHMLGVLAYQSNDFDAAIRLIERAISRVPANAAMHTNLGVALQAKGHAGAAVAAFRRALETDPGFALAYTHLGGSLGARGQHEEAVSILQRARELNPQDTEAHMNLGREFQSLGRHEEAAQCYRRAAELAPDHPSAAFMLASARGERLEKAPLTHVQRLFDHYSERFEKHLTTSLGYSMPHRLRVEFDRIRGSTEPIDHAIDLGCGTGLAGVEFRPLARHLTGVDLSPRMVKKAREKKIYDELSAGDIIALLTEASMAYALFVCADVMPYIGDLTELFGAVRARAAPGAWFLFSTELAQQDDYRLQPTGRYAHSETYLRKLATTYDFTVVECRTEPLRKQQEEWIMGSLVVLRLCSSTM